MASAVISRPKTRQRPKPADGRCLRLSYVDWKMYTQLLQAFAERPAVRLTYDRGELEIMSPLLEHDDDSRFFVALVTVLAEEHRLKLKYGGSATMKKRLNLRGIEADECFWIANARRMAGRRRLDLRRDPPPDLAIEIEVRHGSLDRLSIYAAIQVPEVWWVKEDVMTFYVLKNNGSYSVVAHSLAFPLVSSTDLMRFLKKARESDDALEVLRELRAWVRNRLEQGK